MGNFVAVSVLTSKINCSKSILFRHLMGLFKSLSEDGLLVQSGFILIIMTASSDQFSKEEPVLNAK